MKSLKWFLMAFAALNITACAFDKNTDTDTQNEINDRNALNEKYLRVTGVYTGTVATASGNQDVELSFYTIDKKKGETQDGQPKFLPTLMVRYRILRAVADDINMEVRYIEPTSEFFVSTDTNDFGIHGSFHGNTLQGDVTRNGGKWGALNAELTSRQASTPNDANKCAEKAARFTKIYQQIAGRYVGVVTMDKYSQHPSYSAILTLSPTQVADTECGNKPALLGSFSRVDDRGDTTKLSMSVDYKSELDTQILNLISTQTVGNYSVTIMGTIQNGVIEGAYSSKLGDNGTVRFQKQ